MFANENIEKIKSKINCTLPRPFALLWQNYTEYILRSGRSSGKTTTVEMLGVELMMQAPQNNIVYARAEKSDVIRKNYSSFLSTINKMGLGCFFTARQNPPEVTCTLTGATCFFISINGDNADDTTKTKGFNPARHDRRGAGAKGTIALYFLDEANEVKSPDHVMAAEATMSKFLLPYGKIIYAYNPPPNRNHWANEFFDKKIADGAKLIYTTYRDIWQLLEPKTRELIENMRVNDPRHFRYIYEGKQESLQGRVIYSFNDNCKLTEQALNLWTEQHYYPEYMIYGVDSGIVNDPTAVTCLGLYPDGKLVKLSTFYFDPKELGGGEPLANSKQAQLIITEYRKFRNKMAGRGVTMPPPSKEYWIFDNAGITQALMEELRGASGFNCRPVFKKDIETDVRRLCDFYLQGVLKVLDSEDNEMSFYELENFYRDQNNEIPEGQADHTIDADKYATKFYTDFFYNRFLRGTNVF